MERLAEQHALMDVLMKFVLDFFDRQLNISNCTALGIRWFKNYLNTASIYCLIFLPSEYIYFIHSNAFNIYQQNLISIGTKPTPRFLPEPDSNKAFRTILARHT